jgi:predicted DNA-binding transcriptional regulator YafY
MDSSIEIIRRAINERKLVEFCYRSLPRVVEPMALGEVKRGIWQLRGHQVGGKSSSSRRLPDGKPKLFELTEIASVAVLSDSFDIPVFYTRGDKAFIRIDTQL